MILHLLQPFSHQTSAQSAGEVNLGLKCSWNMSPNYVNTGSERLRAPLHILNIVQPYLSCWSLQAQERPVSDYYLAPSSFQSIKNCKHWPLVL